MTLLISRLADYLVGVLHTTLRTIKTIDAEFEKGAIAFYQDEFGIFSCKIINKKPGRSDGIQFYRVKTDSGLFIDIPSFELMTGWENNFPDLSKVNRGWVSWRQEVAEPLADEYPDSRWNPNQEWEPDDEYYCELAEEWMQEKETSSS